MTQREYWQSPAEVRRVIDGDTVEVLLDTGYRQRLVQTIRVEGIDTCEIFGTKKESDEYQTGMKQKQFAEEFLDVDGEFPIAVTTLEEGKYGGRWIGFLEVGGEWQGTNYVNGTRLADALIEEWPEVENE